MRFNRYFVLIIIITCTKVYAESSVINKKDRRSGPVHITSKKMISEDNGHLIVFTGDVVTKRDSIIIHSDTLEVHNTDNNAKISKIIAAGNVKIDNNGKCAEGEKAIYFERENKIELSGNIKAWENDNIITGDKVIFFIDDDKVVVIGNKDKRVNVTFYPKDEGSKKEQKPSKGVMRLNEGNCRS